MLKPWRGISTHWPKRYTVRHIRVARAGKLSEARAALKELSAYSVSQQVAPYNIALIYNALNERDKAIDWLEKGFEQRDPKMTFLKVEPKWNNLRGDPRFIGLMARMKL